MIGASVGMAVCSVCLAALVNFYAVIAVSASFGLFYGAFLSVDFAMVCMTARNVGSCGCLSVRT